jgi:hypothetical protein
MEAASEVYEVRDASELRCRRCSCSWKEVDQESDSLARDDTLWDRDAREEAQF